MQMNARQKREGAHFVANAAQIKSWVRHIVKVFEKSRTQLSTTNEDGNQTSISKAESPPTFSPTPWIFVPGVSPGAGAPNLSHIMLSRSSPNSRHFWLIFTAAWCVIIAAIFSYATLGRDSKDVSGYTVVNTTLPALPCRWDYFPADQCAFVKTHCGKIDKTSLFPYLQWYYCSGKQTRPAIFIALVLWLVVVFAAMATAADKFLAVNLASLVHSLKISESLAGVTIFAFGNGSSDLFSTLTAMNGGNGSLAIAELFGAAAFITTMVLGAIMIVHPFEIDRKAFVGDLICFIIAAAVNLILLSDGTLALKESLVIIGLYVGFVAYVLIRNRSQSQAQQSSSNEQHSHPPDTENVAYEAVETSALIYSGSKSLTYESHHDGLSSSASSNKTLVVESITERGESNMNGHDDARSMGSNVSDWASEYEHMADVPPFIALCESIVSFRFGSIKSFVSTLLRLPAMICVGLTTITQPEIEHSSTQTTDLTDAPATRINSIVQAPERHPYEYWLLCAQIILGPQFLTWLSWSHSGTYTTTSLYIACGGVFSASAIFLIICRNALLHPGQFLHVCLSTFGFMTATSWIYLIAAEAVALIETLGVMSDVSDALLGATIFAIGNSSDDMFANYSVAKRGHPILASAACLGGPMLNSLLGIGFGSLIQIVRGNYQPYKFHIPASLFVSAASLLTGLSVVLAYVLLRGGKLDKPLGYGLWALWVGFTALNVYVSM